tara:strand:+ start:670 stop:1173 length:504 start_codon:yes stop_codon:yes gene_type:complete
MAFKMKRPLKMAGPKPSGLKLGRKMKNANIDNQISGDEFQGGDTGSGLFYNSDMGPMKMVSPSALKQMEEETMGMMGGMEDEAPAENTAQDKEVPTEEKADSVMGQEIEINEDGSMTMSTEYDVAGIPSGAKVEDPNGILEISGGFVMDNDYTFKVEEGKVVITGVK